MTIRITLLVALLLTAPLGAAAGEIHYGSIKDQKTDKLLIEYKGPSGATYHLCDTVDGDCAESGTTSPKLFPAILGGTEYVRSASGRFAVHAFPLSTRTYYLLYDLRGKEPKRLGAIPFYQKGAKVQFSANENAVVFTTGTTYTRYDLRTTKIAKTTLPQALSFASLSPSATYVSGYNYGTLRHEVWKIGSQKTLFTPSSMQSYLEFSEDERQVAFLEDVDGFRTLYTMHTRELGETNPDSLAQVTEPRAEVEDYLFAGNRLFFLANIDHPHDWDLFTYHLSRKSVRTIDTDISYGDFLKRVRTSDGVRLAYLKTEGKNTHVHLYDPSEGTRVVLDAVVESPRAEGISYEKVKVDGRYGVLLSPEKPGRDANLFIWLHGGPQRQAWNGYHPYLSYAVYDELLERLVDGGNYVLKLDYTGSAGYGAGFRKALHMKIGDVEIDDVENAIEVMEDEYDIDNVYLIGNSYGGYMALKGIADLHKKVDGAVSINGVSDWYALINRIPSSPFRSLFEGVPDNHNMKAYFAASVYSGMQNLDDDHKILVVWGEEDATVPVWQSEDYIEFARTQEADVSALSFPNEDHILRKRETLDVLCDAIVDNLDLEGVGCRL